MMKKTARIGAMLGAAMVLAAPAYAQGVVQPNGGAVENGAVINGAVITRSVPEIDAAGAMLAFSLMGGIVAIVRERRRRKSK